MVPQGVDYKTTYTHRAHTLALDYGPNLLRRGKLSPPIFENYLVNAPLRTAPTTTVCSGQLISKTRCILSEFHWKLFLSSRSAMDPAFRLSASCDEKPCNSQSSNFSLSLFPALLHACDAHSNHAKAFFGVVGGKADGKGGPQS